MGTKCWLRERCCEDSILTRDKNKSFLGNVDYLRDGETFQIAWLQHEKEEEEEEELIKRKMSIEKLLKQEKKC